MADPWPGVVPGVDVSLERVADLKVAKGGADLAAELERPRRRPAPGPGPKLYRRLRRNPPDPQDPLILSDREVARIEAGIYSD